MKIKMKSTAAGPSGTFNKGDIVDIPEEMAKSYIECGAAEPVRSQARARHVIEEASLPGGAETAALRQPGAKGKPAAQKGAKGKPNTGVE